VAAALTPVLVNQGRAQKQDKAPHNRVTSQMRPSVRAFSIENRPIEVLGLPERMDTLIQAFEKGDGLIRCADQESALFELHHHHKAALTER